MSTVTQSELAKMAGVTRLTVRRALEGKPGVGSDTAARIRKIATQQGYRPNAAALATRSGRFNAIALLIGSKNPLYLPAELVYGAERDLVASHRQLLFASLNDNQLENSEFMPKVLRHLMVDGLLIHDVRDASPAMQELVRRHRIPAIWVNTRLDADCVYLDDRAAAEHATRVLIAHGHTRIAYAISHQRGHYSETDRRGGYRTAMTSAGLTPVELVAQPSAPSPTHDHRLAAARAWLEQPDRPTALLTYEQSTATPVLAAAMSLGMTVPRDLSLITFARLDFSDIGQPLTHIHASLKPAAEIAVDMLDRKIAAPAKPIDPQPIQPPLSDLFSVAAPPA